MMHEQRENLASPKPVVNHCVPRQKPLGPRLFFSRFQRCWRFGCASLLLSPILLAAAEVAIGWRGDGTGRFPKANPPVTWSRVSGPMKGLRFQARKPVPDTAAGVAMPDGVIREWLVLGPVAVPDVPNPSEKDTIPDEVHLSPDEGGKIGNLEWKRIEAKTATLDFTTLFGSNQNAFAYAHAYVYSETGGAFILQFTHRSGTRVILNDRQVYGSPATYGGRISLPLAKGWNRLLFKVRSDDSQWFGIPVLHAHQPQTYEEKNIAWMTPLPGAQVYQGSPAAAGGPIVVSNRIFLLCEPHDLFCLNKTNGKVLWARSNSYFDALDENEKSSPAFQKMEPLAAQWNALLREYVAGHPSKAAQGERDRIEKELYGAMKAIDGKRFKRPAGQDVGYAGFTPASDGKHVYVWFASGVTACYDLEGTRKWIRIDNHEGVEHGFTSSPVLTDDKVVVFMRELMAFDKEHGHEAWRNSIVGPTGLNPGGFFHGSFATARFRNLETVIPGNGTVVGATDGKVLFHDERIDRQNVPSPVFADGLLCVMSAAGGSLHLVRWSDDASEPANPVSNRTLKVPTGHFPYYYLGWHIASPLVHDGLIYLMNCAGVLTVVDQNTGAILYQRLLDLDHFETANEGAARGLGISPAFAGKHIYCFGNSGSAVVIEPGREFRQVAKNKIEGLAVPGTWGERQDRSVARPFFDESRIYYRTESGLYALETQESPGGQVPAVTYSQPVEAPETSRPEPRPANPTLTSRTNTPPISTDQRDGQVLQAAQTASPSGTAEHLPATFGWRGDGSGRFPAANPPTEWDGDTGKNILWKTTVGSSKFSAATLVNGKVFVVAEPANLICVDANDGRILWSRSNDAADLPKPVQVRPESGSQGNTTPTPISDGRCIYALFGSGIVACYTLDGERRWIEYIEAPAGLEYGRSASPAIIGGKLLVTVHHLFALDTTTGRILWENPQVGERYGTPVPTRAGGIDTVLMPGGQIVRAVDGKIMATASELEYGSPISDGRRCFFIGTTASAVTLSGKDGIVTGANLWQVDLDGSFFASPVYDNGMIYSASVEGQFVVLDAMTGRKITAADLDIGSAGGRLDRPNPNIYPSLVIAGNYLFVSNDAGETLVLKPGGSGKLINRNHLGEGFAGAPVFAGSRMYVRTKERLYCVTSSPPTGNGGASAKPRTNGNE